MSAGTERFSGDAEITVELMHWRRFPEVCFRRRKRQPERLGYRQWREFNRRYDQAITQGYEQW